MAQGSATAADIPGKFDVVIGGFGYQLLDTLEPSLPFRSHRATYGNSPTFVERQNVGPAYGDNQQDFWMTVSQTDWSLGEDQRFFRITDDTSRRRYWRGANVDSALIPGQVAIQQATQSYANSEAILSACADANGKIYGGGSASLASTTGVAFTNKGAHGLGAAPSQWGMTCDPNGYVYLSTTTGGGVGVRKYNLSVFATFSATGADALAYLNNALYGYRSNDGTFIRYDSAGTATTLYTRRGADGAAVAVNPGSTTVKLIPYGGKLAMLFLTGAKTPELWVYDGVGVSKLADLPQGFTALNACEAQGGIFISGYGEKGAPTILYYVNGSLGVLWSANDGKSTGPVALCALGTKLAFADASTNSIAAWDLAGGGVTRYGNGELATAGAIDLVTGGYQTASIVAIASSGPTQWIFAPGLTASTATVATSLFDFDSSLTKVIRGVTVDWTSATDGGGGSVDIAYQIGSVDGTYTTLKTGATSGQEYTLNQNGRSVSVKVTLNKGTSTNGPVLKRIYVRASPLLQTYRKREFVLDLSGIGFKDPVLLNDGSPHPLSGHEQASNLIAAVQAAAPFTIADRFGSFTGILEPDQCEIYEVREGNDSPQFSGGFVAKITAREV